MRKRPQIAVADLIRAVRALRPKDDVEELAVAQVLGFAVVPAPTVGAHGPAIAATVRVQPDLRAEGIKPPGPSAATGPRLRPVSVDPNPTAQFAISGPLPSESIPIPWLAGSAEFETTPQAPAKTTVSLAPLLTPKGTRAILSTALGVPGPNGPVDLPRIVDAIARSIPLHELPRLRGFAIAPQVDVLLDVGDTMMPFAQDQHNIQAPLRSVARSDNVRKLKFVGSPLRGAGTDRDDVWPVYSFPPSGSLVVLLTDFGIGRGMRSDMLDSAAEWRRFALELRRRRVACTAFVPYTRNRWPAEARRLFNIVQWDRVTSAGSVKFSKR